MQPARAVAGGPVLSASRSRSRSDLVGRRANRVRIHLDRAQTCCRHAVPCAPGRSRAARPGSARAHRLGAMTNGSWPGAAAGSSPCSPSGYMLLFRRNAAYCSSAACVRNLKILVVGGGGLLLSVWNGGGGKRRRFFFLVFYCRGAIELGRVTNAQCDRSVPLGTGGAESARRRVPGCPAPRPGSPGAASIRTGRPCAPGPFRCVSGSTGPGASLPSISSTATRSTGSFVSPPPPPFFPQEHPSCMQIKTTVTVMYNSCIYARMSLVESPEIPRR